MQYESIQCIPSLELRSIIEAFIQVKRKQQEDSKQDTLDCEIVNDDDYKKWFT